MCCAVEPRHDAFFCLAPIFSTGISISYRHPPGRANKISKESCLDLLINNIDNALDDMTSEKAGDDP